MTDKLREAATAIYNAAIWYPDRAVDAGKLWTDLREALGLEPGASTRALSVSLRLHRLAGDIHQGNVDAGWWNDFKTNESALLTRNRPEVMKLIVSEVVEADDGYLDNLMDDKLPHLPMFDVELADVAIRLFDLIGAENAVYGGVQEVDYDDLIAKHYLKNESSNVTRMLLNIVKEVSRGMEHIRKKRIEEYRLQMSEALAATFAIAALNEIDLFDVIEQKRAFNAVRPDHKKENRVKDGGKTF